MNVHEADRLPWMRGEIELLRDALAADMPIIGVCLGAQLLAAAAGAEVRRAREPEIGWHEAWRIPAGAEDPLLGRMPERFCAYQWHSYVSETPAGAVVLACSAVCPQAFRIGERAWGVQFHPEVTPDIVRGWTLDYGSDPDAVAAGVVPEAALAEAERRLPEWMAIGAELFDAFLDAAATGSAAAAGRPAALAPPLPHG